MDETDKVGSHDPVAVLLVAMLALGCGKQLSGTVTVAGSTTVQPLAELLADEFMGQNPDVEVTISGGGTSVGITSVNNGTVDIGAASRELKSDEPRAGGAPAGQGRHRRRGRPGQCR